MEDNGEANKEARTIVGLPRQSDERHTWPPLLDSGKYLAEIEDWDVSEAQKVEFLQTLWSILCSFVELGFGVDSVQHLLPELAGKTSVTSGNELECKDSFQTNAYEKAATDSAAKED